MALTAVAPSQQKQYVTGEEIQMESAYEKTFFLSKRARLLLL